MSELQVFSNVQLLGRALGCKWEHIQTARSLAEQTRAELQAAVHGIDSEDTSIVVSGSLARDEFTQGSDIDWSLLVDGSADPKHHDLLRKIADTVGPFMAKTPGAEGTF